MNRWTTCTIVVATAYLALSNLAGPFSAGAAEPPPGAGVFEMKYRGLNGPDDSLSYGSYWSFGAPSDDTGQKDPFVLAVKNRVKECTLVYNALPQRQWSVVELKDKKPIGFYFDLNADGKFSDDEKFLPAASSGSPPNSSWVFLTSDFLIRTNDRREIPFRVMLVGNSNGAEISYMWSPACVLEGQGTLVGQPTRLVLFSNGFGGSFTEFGQCDIMLLPAERKLEGYIPHYMRNTLSGLIYHQGAFYRLKLQGTHTSNSTIRVAIEKDTTPTGQATIEVAGQEGLKTHPTTIWLQGAKDASIHLHLENTQPTLPVGQYRVSYGSLGYGLQSSSEWNASVRDGPPFDLKAAGTTRVSLGQPVLSVKAIEEKDRTSDNARERSTYARGTPIYLSPRIKGKTGELYTLFSRRTTGSGSSTNVKSHVTIVNAAGKEVVSADMEYG